MKVIEAIEILKYHNEWRKGTDDRPQTDVKKLTEAIDVIINHYE